MATVFTGKITLYYCLLFTFMQQLNALTKAVSLPELELCQFTRNDANIPISSIIDETDHYSYNRDVGHLPTSSRI